MIDLAILGLLKEQDLHGYELRKRLGDLPGARAGVVSFGSLYPALARLERGGLVKGVEANTRTDRAAPSSGSLAGQRAPSRPPPRVPRPRAPRVPPPPPPADPGRPRQEGVRHQPRGRGPARRPDPRP